MVNAHGGEPYLHGHKTFTTLTAIFNIMDVVLKSEIQLMHPSLYEAIYSGSSKPRYEIRIQIVVFSAEGSLALKPEG